MIKQLHRTKSHDDHVTDDSVRENVQYSLVIEHAFGDGNIVIFNNNN